MEAAHCRGMGAVPERTLALVRRPRLHLGQRRPVGLAALSLRPVDAQRRYGLGVGALAEECVQARRCVLAARAAHDGLGAAGAGRRVVGHHDAATVSRGQHHMGGLPARCAGHQSERLHRPAKGAVGGSGLPARAAFADVSGVAPGSDAAGAARRLDAFHAGAAGHDLPGHERRSAASRADDATAGRPSAALCRRAAAPPPARRPRRRSAPAPPSAAAPPPASPPDPGPPGPPMSTTYPVPDYTGIIVINPPDHPNYSRPNPNNPRNNRQTGQNGQTGSNTPQPPASTPSLPRVVKQPDEARPNSGPRMTPVEHPRIAPPREVKSETPPASAAPSAPPQATRVEAPRPSPPS